MGSLATRASIGRPIAALIGAAYARGVPTSKLTDNNWGYVVEFVRGPQETAKAFEVAWPKSKGRWDGAKGYKAQLVATMEVLAKILV